MPSDTCPLVSALRVVECEVFEYAVEWALLGVYPEVSPPYRVSVRGDCSEPDEVEEYLRLL